MNADQIMQKIDEVQCENYRLKAENASYANLKALPEDFGLAANGWYTKDRLRELAAEFRSKVPKETRDALRRAQAAIGELLKEIGSNEAVEGGGHGQTQTAAAGATGIGGRGEGRDHAAADP